MNRIVFVEGVPGSGKTTLIAKLLEHDNGNSRPVVVYSGDVNPVNPVRQATKQGACLSLQEAKIIYRSQPYSSYKEEHIQKWIDFCEQNAYLGTDFIVDAGLIQAPMYELLGRYMMTATEIAAHLNLIIEIIKDYFDIQMVYLEVENPARCIHDAMELQHEWRKQWVAGFCKWLEIAPYPISKGYTGLQGIEDFVYERHQIDQLLLPQLHLKIQAVERDEVCSI